MSRVVPETLTVYVRFRIRKHGGRKVMDMPVGAPVPPHHFDNTMIKALARAFRWKRMLESGEYTTIAELSAKEQLAVSYMARVLRMAQLAPDIVEAILEGRQPKEMALADLLETFSVNWVTQKVAFGLT